MKRSSDPSATTTPASQYDDRDPAFDDGGVFGLGHRPPRLMIGAILPHESSPTCPREPPRPARPRATPPAALPRPAFSGLAGLLFSGPAAPARPRQDARPPLSAPARPTVFPGGTAPGQSLAAPGDNEPSTDLPRLPAPVRQLPPTEWALSWPERVLILAAVVVVLGFVGSIIYAAFVP